MTREAGRRPTRTGKNSGFYLAALTRPAIHPIAPGVNRLHDDTVDFHGDFQTIAGQTGDIIGNPVERNRAVSAVSRYCLRPKCFVTEGWSLYWDLLLWDMQYQKTPAERIGVVFWHMHHRARLIF